jgi:uncharacterized protein
VSAGPRRPAHGRPFTSDLSGQDFWTLCRAGARPVGLVLGSCVYSVTNFNRTGWRVWRNVELPHFTQALYDARELAMTRMQREASALAAQGIVGVQLTEHHHGWGGRAIEFLALGTAIVRDGPRTSAPGNAAAPVIDLSDSSRRPVAPTVARVGLRGPILSAIGASVASMTTLRRTYPEGVPSWVDTDQQDPQAAQEFYARLLGWTFTTVSPPGAPIYAIAALDGRDVAGMGQAQDGAPAWNTYIAVDDADAAVARIAAAGGEVTEDSGNEGPFGRSVNLRDPAGVAFRLWQAKEHHGAQRVNEPGSWNFSDLHTDHPDMIAFYAGVFAWSVEDLGFATMVRRPGYGDHLEATVDPDIRARQADVAPPSGFEDAIAWVAPLEPGLAPHWHVSFSVADRDAAAAQAQRLGAEVLGTEDTQWTRTALIRDPQGAMFTASQFTPPD